MEQTKLQTMDEQADNAIANWSFTALAANLLPPPFDVMAVRTAFGKMGARLAEIYEVQVSWPVIKSIEKSTAKGVGAVFVASYIGTGLLKYVPGVNIWVALLIQPPMVAAVAYSVGKAFKQYFHIRITEGRDLTPDQVRELAETALREKLGASL
jgi:uncharacterized protein (DUF697 family)